MTDKMDWAAAMSSEVFRNYAMGELRKEMQQAQNTVNKDAALDDFEAFQRRVNASPRLQQEFKKLQQVFTTDPEYTAKVDPQFVEGVLLLNVEDK